MLANKPVKILAVSLSPSRPVIASDLSACLGGGLPVLMAGDLNAKRIEWNSRLITNRDRILRDYVDKNSCLIYKANTPTTVPYNPSATPDNLDIAITKNMVSPVYLTTCSALSTDHLSILINKQCRSSLLSPPDRPDLRTEWPKFQACLEAGFPSKPDLPNEVAIDARVKKLSSAISKALTDSTPKCRPRGGPRPPLPTRIQDKIRLKTRLRRKWQTTKDLAL